MRVILIILLLQVLRPVFSQETAIYQPVWDNLSKHQAPEWFRNAKFGFLSIGACIQCLHGLPLLASPEAIPGTIFTKICPMPSGTLIP